MEESSSKNTNYSEDEENEELLSRVWIETKKLWRIVGPNIINRLAGYSMTVITQAFAGHLGNVELASISIATNIIVGFGFALLVIIDLVQHTSISQPTLTYTWLIFTLDILHVSFRPITLV